MMQILGEQYDEYLGFAWDEPETDNEPFENNTLGYIDYLINECGYTEEEAERCANYAYAEDYTEEEHR